MITIDIPGKGTLDLQHLILDYNGTIALDGKVIESVRERIELLSEHLSVYVITADTHGTAAQNCEGLPLTVMAFPGEGIGQIKAQQAKKLGGRVVCIGNGFNDIQMSDVCDLSVCVIGAEGCCGCRPGCRGCSGCCRRSLRGEGLPADEG